MRENKPVQLEIFKSSHSSETGKRANPFLEYLWGYEKTILIFIAIVAVGVLSFSLGVEKGKRMARREAAMDTSAAAANTKRSQPTVQPVQRIEIKPAQVAVSTAPRPASVAAMITAPQARPTAQPKAQPAQPAAQPVKLSGQQGSFTIQVGSYKNKTSADTQAQAFKKKGISTMVLPKGGYLVLCIGRFPSQDEARIALKELQKQYKGCYIRRL